MPKMNANKTLFAAITAAIGWGFLVVMSPSHAITSLEWMQLAKDVAVTTGVYGIANTVKA